MSDTAPSVSSERRRVRLAELRPHPRNYQKHPPDQIEHIKRSLVDFGQYRDVVIGSDGVTILAGHGVVESAEALGWEEIDVIVLGLLPFEPLALRLLAGDNEISNLAEVDNRALTELLREVGADPLVGLLGSGFDDLQLAALAMISRPASELRDLAASAEWVGLPDFEATPTFPQVNVRFETEEDRTKFLAHIGVTTTMAKNGVITTWWPERGGTQDLSSVRFQ